MDKMMKIPELKFIYKYRLWILSLFCSLFFIQKVSGFGYLTHIHINKEADLTLGKIFETYGVMPDSFNLDNINFIYTYSGSFEYVAIADILHSPDPKESPIGSGFCPYQDKPSFGYLLLKTAESNNKINASKGLAGHIAADWVAHKFLKIIDLESRRHWYDKYKQSFKNFKHKYK